MGPVDVPEELEEAEPEDLIGKAISMNIKLEKATNLPKTLCTNPHVTYALAWEPSSKEYTTNTAPGGMVENPAFNYCQKHTIDCVTDYHIQKLDSGSIAFNVWAYPYHPGSKGAAGVTQEF